MGREWELNLRHHGNGNGNGKELMGMGGNGNAASHSRTSLLQDRLHHCEIYATSFKTLQRLSLSLIAKIHVYTSTQSAVDDTEQSEV